MIYRKEPKDFGRNYAKECDEGLTPLLSSPAVAAHSWRVFVKSRNAQTGLFSAVSSAFVNDVQFKLDTDLNGVNAFREYLVPSATFIA